jgi:prepilin-type N-terminal cleavage/methylation domain-containing protein
MLTIIANQINSVPLNLSSYNKKGFTLIEILLVISIIGIMFSVSMPISYNMYNSYKASIKAQEVMVFVSGLRLESFLYSEGKTLSSMNEVITVNGLQRSFADTHVQIDQPIIFYKNGTTSGGIVKIYVGDQAYSLSVKAPLGDLILERVGKV